MPVFKPSIVFQQRILFVMLLCLLVIGHGTAQEETEVVGSQASFRAYQCTFFEETNALQVRASLMSANGTPIPRSQYSVNVTAGGLEVSSNAITAEVDSQRPPLRMILVFDITETVPVTALVNVLQDEFLPRLQPEDQIALLAFSGEVAPVSNYYTDKDRFIEEQMLDLRPLLGDNRLYDAIFDAVTALPFNTERRQVVLVMTDSRPREDNPESSPQVEPQVIIADALQARTQVFTIGFYTADQPDEEGLLEIATGTRGYAWLYDERPNTTETVIRGVTDLLTDFSEVLNTELIVTVDARDIQPDGNNRVSLDIEIDADNEPTLTETISCPIERLNATIEFVDDLNNLTVTGPVDVGVRTDTDLQDAQIVFLVNDEIVQNSTEDIYTFDTPDRQPGYYTVRAQLRDQNSDVLAETEDSIRLFAQQSITLTQQELNGPNDVLFSAVVPQGITLGNAFFTVALSEQPNITYPLVDDPIPFDTNGRAVLALSDFRGRLDMLPLGVGTGDLLEITAFVPAADAEQPLRATSNTLAVRAPEPLPTPIPPTPTPGPVVIAPAEGRYIEVTPTEREDIMLPALLIGMFVLNLLLLRQIGKERVRRLIRSPDNIEMDGKPMSITVQAEGVRQTHPLTKRTVYIGRGVANDINLGGDAYISRQHAVVMWRRGQWYYANRKRRARARIDGKWRRGLVLTRIEPITNLEIGDAHLVFHSSAQKDISDFMSTNI